MRYLRIDDTHLTLVACTGSRQAPSPQAVVAFEHRALSPTLSLEADLCDLCQAHKAFAEVQPTQVVVEGRVTLGRSRSLKRKLAPRSIASA